MILKNVRKTKEYLIKEYNNNNNLQISEVKAKINTLATKLTLNNITINYTEILIKAMSTFIFCLLFFNLPYIFLAEENKKHFFNIFPSFLLVNVNLFYNIKKRFDYKIAIKNICDNNSIDFNEEKSNNEDLIDNLIRFQNNSIQVRLELESQKRKLEKLKQFNYLVYPNKITEQDKEIGISRNLEKKE